MPNAASGGRRLLDLAVHALNRASLIEVFEDAADLLQEELGVTHAGLVQFLPDGVTGMVRLARGWRTAIPGATLPTGPGSQSRFLIDHGSPLIVDDFETETRFERSPLVRAEQLVSCVSVLVNGTTGPWGMLAVHTREPRSFSNTDAEVIVTLGAVLSSAIQHSDVEEYLRAVTSAAQLAFLVGGLGAWAWNQALGVVTWTAELEALCGIPPGSFPGTAEAFLALVHPDDRERAAAFIANAVSSGGEIDFEYRIVRPDGEVRWLEGRGRRLDPVDGRGSTWIGVGIDVTERHRSAERLDVLLASAPAALAFFDGEFRCILANESMCQLVGRSRDEVVGQRLDDVCADLSPSLSEMAPALADAPERRIEVEVSGSLGRDSARHWLASLYSLGAAEDRSFAVGLVLVEITARRRAEVAERLLREASQLLASPLGRVEMMDRFVSVALPDLADCCTITLVDEYRSDRLVATAVAHIDPQMEALLHEAFEFAVPDISGATPTAVAIRTGRPCVVSHIDADMRDSGLTDPHRRELARTIGVSSAISVPLVVGGRVIGAFTFMCCEPSGRRLGPQDLALIDELGRHCADALERIELRVAADRARARLSLLARVGELVEIELDSNARLTRVAELAIPDLGSLCAAFLADETSIRLVTIAVHSRSLGRDLHIEPGVSHPLDSRLPWARAAAEQRVVIADLSDPTLSEGADSDVAIPVESARELGVSSVLCVPLRLEGRVIGTLAFGRGDSDTPGNYDDDDVALASEIARRVTPAVVHALRYEREREMVTVLQHSLLPESIPSSELVATEARYLSGTQGLRVGGDWYDAIQFDDGRMLLVIGDVVGHGVRAATLMGQLRTAVRVGWLESTRPGQLLTRLNRFLTGAGPGAMATCLLILLDPATGMVEWSSAGHPPAVLRDPSGSAVFLEGGLGPPLGVVDLISYPEASTLAEPGSRIVMFTDGLFERRGVPIDDMLDLVRDCVAAGSDPLRNLCDDLIAQLIGNRPLVDDAAILAVELVRPAAVFEHSLRNARQLAGLRAHLRAWLGASGVDTAASSDLVLAASELAANAIEHGYSGTGSGVVAVRANFEDDAVALSVEDSGRWRAPGTAGSDRGRGLPIVRALSDDLVMEVTQHGTSARVLVRASAASPRHRATG